MNRIIISTSILLITLTSCAEDTFEGSGLPISEIRNVANFSKVSSEGVFEVSIVQGDTQSVEIIADHNIMHRVKTEVVDNELRLYVDDHNYKDITLKAIIVAEKVNGIKNTGIGNVDISNVDEDGIFEVYNSGTGNISIAGSAESLALFNEGDGMFKGFSFDVSNCNVNLIGSGDCEVSVKSKLNVNIEGAGHVYYKGAPVIEATILGSGELIDSN